jgi:Tfp pilus assembly protein FimT
VTAGPASIRPVRNSAARRSRPAGTTFVELVVAVGVTTLLASIAVPVGLAGRDRYRAGHAAQYLATVVRLARNQAIARNAHVAIRFSDDADGGAWTVYVDGNGDGVRAADVTRGVDRPLGPPARLVDVAAGVQFAILSGTTDIDSGAALVGSGLRLGSGNWLAFSPLGTASSGTVYLAGSGRQQYAVRVLGTTGRVRLLRFDASSRIWTWP